MIHVPRKKIYTGVLKDVLGSEGATIEKRFVHILGTHARPRNIKPGLVFFLTAFQYYLTSKCSATFVFYLLLNHLLQYGSLFAYLHVAGWKSGSCSFID